MSKLSPSTIQVLITAAQVAVQELIAKIPDWIERRRARRAAKNEGIDMAAPPAPSTPGQDQQPSSH